VVTEERYLSVQDIRTRWSCGRTFVYEAIAEMEVGGYLKRMWLGRHQRIALESVEHWEAAHVKPRQDNVRSTVVKLRAANDAPPRKPAMKPRSAAEMFALFKTAL
jgi:hypothetical protein